MFHLTRWQLCKLLFRVIFSRDFAAVAAALFQRPAQGEQSTPAPAPPTASRFEYNVVSSRMAMKAAAGLIVAALATSAMAGGSISVMDPITKLPKLLRGGEGININPGTGIFTATGEAVISGNVPFDNISTGLQGKYLPLSGTATSAGAYKGNSAPSATEFSYLDGVSAPIQGQISSVRVTAEAKPDASNVTPVMNGTAAAGTAPTVARADHIHASDTSREPANSNIQAHIGSTSNPHSVTKAQVNLGNADNTSDLNKPISTATQTALNLKASIASLGTVAFTNSYTDLFNKPAVYTLPTMSTTVKGGAKVDGTTIVVDGNGVISSTVSAGVSTVNGGTGDVTVTPENIGAATLTAFSNYTGVDRVTVDAQAITDAAQDSATAAAAAVAGSALQPTGVTAGTITDTDTVAFARSGGFLSSAWSGVKTALRSAFDTVYATASQGVKADAALPATGGTVTGQINMPITNGSHKIGGLDVVPDSDSSFRVPAYIRLPDGVNTPITANHMAALYIDAGRSSTERIDNTKAASFYGIRVKLAGSGDDMSGGVAVENYGGGDAMFVSVNSAPNGTQSEGYAGEQRPGTNVGSLLRLDSMPGYSGTEPLSKFLIFEDSNARALVEAYDMPDYTENGDGFRAVKRNAGTAFHGIHYGTGDFLKMENDSGSVKFKVAASGAPTIGAYTLPVTDGGSGHVLKTNGSGAVTWQAEGGSYTLPIASGTVLGGIKVGSNLSIDGAGVLSASASGAGTVSSITAGTGLTGGEITTTGTIAVDVGTTANKIPQLNADAKYPATLATALQLGSENVPNGDFSSNTNWTFGTNWAYNSGTGKVDAAGTTAGQSLTFTGFSPTAGVRYRIGFTISGYSGTGVCTLVFGGNTLSGRAANGTYVIDTIATTTGQLVISGSSVGFTGSLDDISIKQITGGDLVSGEFLGVGVTTPRWPAEVYSNSSPDGTTMSLTLDGPVAAHGFYMTDYVPSASAGNAFFLRHSRGSQAAPSDVLAGDRIASFFFQANAGTSGTTAAFKTPASIEAYVDPNAGTITATNVPTYLSFRTAAPGSATRVERVKVDSNGLTVAAYILAGYEEKTASYTVSKDASKITLASGTATVTLPKTLPANSEVNAGITVAGVAASGVTIAVESGGSISWGDAGAPTFTNNKTSDVVCKSQNVAATTTAAWRCTKGGNF